MKLADLASSSFIFFEHGFVLNGIIAVACRRRGLTFVEAARSGNADFIVALVAAGLGLAFLPRLEMATRSGLSVHAVEVAEADFRWKLGLIWRKGAVLSPPAARWLALVREELELDVKRSTIRGTGKPIQTCDAHAGFAKKKHSSS